MPYNTKPIGVAYADPQLDGVGLGASGGTVGFYGTTPVTQPAALTAQLTTVTFTAPGTPDYAIADLIQNTGYGFVAADEGQTVLSVIANLQVRLAQVEARLEGLGLIASN